MFNKRGDIKAVIDFDDFRMDTIYEDLSWTIVIGSRELKESPKDEYRYVSALLNGYATVSKLTNTDREILSFWVDAMIICAIIKFEVIIDQAQLIKWHCAVRKAIFRK